jgi:hypothetical protein
MNGAAREAMVLPGAAHGAPAERTVPAFPAQGGVA